MKWMQAVALGCLLAACTAGVRAQQSAVVPPPTAAQIVEKNAAARGGVEAWQKIETMAWAGHTETDGAPGRKLPFILEQKRPNNTRFELMTDGHRSIRGYNGSAGWKLRADSSGRPELQPYSDDELKFARGAQVIDGPLMDYAAKRALISLVGVDQTGGRKAYVLDVKLPTGGLHRVWVDAETFLELRHDREVHNAAGRTALVSVSFRDYRAFEGLQIPLTIETSAEKGQATNKLVIEKVALNPTLDEKMFALPNVPVVQRRGVTVDTRNAAAGTSKVMPLP